MEKGCAGAVLTIDDTDGLSDMLKGYDKYVTQWDTHSVVQYSLPERYLLLRVLNQSNRGIFSSQPFRCTGITCYLHTLTFTQLRGISI